LAGASAGKISGRHGLAGRLVTSLLPIWVPPKINRPSGRRSYELGGRGVGVLGLGVGVFGLGVGVLGCGGADGWPGGFGAGIAGCPGAFGGGMAGWPGGFGAGIEGCPGGFSGGMAGWLGGVIGCAKVVRPIPPTIARM